MDRVVTLHPRLAPTHFARAQMLFDLKRYHEALDELNVALDLEPGRNEYYFSRAVILGRLGRENDALPDIRKSCELGNVVACVVLKKLGKADN
jgi:Flp pilus assembly protein TadD